MNLVAIRDFSKILVLLQPIYLFAALFLLFNKISEIIIDSSSRGLILLPRADYPPLLRHWYTYISRKKDRPP